MAFSQKLKDGRVFLPIGTFFGFVAVIAAAAISHRVMGDLEKGGAYLFQMAVIFHLGHALALMFIGMFWARAPKRTRPSLRLAGYAFTLGVILFCGSLYILSTAGPGSLGQFSFITPVGGTAFIIGWLALCLMSFQVMGPHIGRGSKK